MDAAARDLILIVEDVDPLREGLREILTVEGFDVKTARNGKDALEMMRIAPPSLIVSDITMPVMDGYDFYQAVRLQPEWVNIPFIFLTAHSDAADYRTGRSLGVDDYLTKPISREELVTTVRARLNRFGEAQVARVRQAYLDSLIILANAIEHRSPSNADHTARITEIAMLIAAGLGWPAKKQADLRFAAILHDIGKIHISNDLLSRAGPLNETEWELIRRHPVTGAEMLRDLPLVSDCIAAVRHHHERWDGGGYPDGLAGEAIPEGARLLAVADSLDRITSNRPYAHAASLDAACAEIERMAGAAYDPAIVRVVLDAYADGRLQRMLNRIQEQRPAIHDEYNQFLPGI